MELMLPQSTTHPLIQVTVTAPNFESVTYLDTSHTTFTPDLPAGIDPELVTVTASLCDQHRNVIPALSEWTLKAASKQDASPSQENRLDKTKTEWKRPINRKAKPAERKADRVPSTDGEKR